MLAVSHLRAGYDEGEVLHGLSLTVAVGEVVCLIGSNGAGIAVHVFEPRTVAS